MEKQVSDELCFDLFLEHKDYQLVQRQLGKLGYINYRLKKPISISTIRAAINRYMFLNLDGAYEKITRVIPDVDRLEFEEFVLSRLHLWCNHKRETVEEIIKKYYLDEKFPELCSRMLREIYEQRES